MDLQVKICGLNSAPALAAAVEGGAGYVGFVFYPPSPRYLAVADAAALAADVPAHVTKVGLFVDADDATIANTIKGCPLDHLQFHGDEDADRVRAARASFGLPVMKAIRLGGPDDLAQARDFIGAADRLLFDAKPPAAMTTALPGGNALAFDWQLLEGATWPLPWMLSGGLDAGNLARAVAATGARAVDVSSGVEDRPGHKVPELISAFLAAAAKL